MGWKDDCTVEIIYRGTGTTQHPGGQHVGSPASDIRITHKPTNLMAQVGERSQHKNKAIAFDMLEYGLLSLGWKLKDDE